MAQDLAARFSAAHRMLATAAVTGTNGKSTTTSMIEAIVAASGEPSARLTTLGAWVAGERIAAEDGNQEFLQTVERACAVGVKTLALEVTSKALANGLARRWRPRVAVFTNLSRDHMDMHGSPEAYLAAKAQLFMALPEDGVAVLNGDDPTSELVREVIPPGARVWRFSVAGDDAGGELVARRVATSAAGTRVELAPGGLADALEGTLVLGVSGDVHAQNALAAALATHALGYPPDAIRRGLAEFQGVPGRFQIVHRAPLVVVDYAHTPDGLRGTLATARAMLGKDEAAARASEDGRDARVICVFGCGGNRDRGKRPEMGAIAHQQADLVVLTSDNPRREDPRVIADDITGGARGPGARWHRELDRARAIGWAVNEARAGDIVVIAGKGHEDHQEIMDQKLPMSDAELARAACASRDTEG